MPHVCLSVTIEYVIMLQERKQSIKAMQRTLTLAHSCWVTSESWSIWPQHLLAMSNARLWTAQAACDGRTIITPVVYYYGLLLIRQVLCEGSLENQRDRHSCVCVEERKKRDMKDVRERRGHLVSNQHMTINWFIHSGLRKRATNSGVSEMLYSAKDNVTAKLLYTVPFWISRSVIWCVILDCVVASILAKLS